jgi:lysophospholipase L1-like esterase
VAAQSGSNRTQGQVSLGDAGRKRLRRLASPTFLLCALGVLALFLLAGGSLASISPASAPPAPASPAPASPASVLYVVHLGDIWRYDSGSQTAEIVVQAEGKSIGHPSWSLDETALAWEEREVVDGRLRSRVVFRGPADVPGGLRTTWTVDGASSPAVSPDGRYLLYQTAEGATTSLHVLGTTGEPVLSIENARNGCWVSVPGTATLVAFDRDTRGFPSNEGFYVRDLRTGAESMVTAANAWAPQARSSDGGYLITQYSAEGGRAHIAVMAAGTVEPLLDVTNNEAFDYRWCHGQAGKERAYLELVPMAGGRSDIYQATDTAAGPGPQLTLLASSFGWNASLPSQSPFSDMGRGDPYYQAVACLSANQVIGGFGDHTFRPGDPIKRAQFAKMLDGALGIAVYEGLPLAPLSDLRQNVSPLYPREYVSAAYYYDLVRGYPKGLFRPWDKISRMQVVTMIVRSAGAYLPGGLKPLPEGWTGETSGFSEADHGPNVHLAEYNGLLAGIDLSDWNLKAPAQRGEVAQLLINLMRVHGPLFDSDTLPGFAGPPAGASTGVVPTVSAKAPIGNIVFAGDSLTAGSTATDPYPSQLMRRFRPDVRWVNLGIGGQRLEEMLDNAPIKVDPLYDIHLGQNVVVVWGGTNDIRHWLHSPEVVYSQLRQYCLERREKGFTVVAMTLLPRSDGTYPADFEANRQAVNRKIRATWPGFADAFVDVGADRLIGRPGCELNRGFFSGDRVHLNNSGLAVVAGLVGQLLRRLDPLGVAPVD